MVLEKKNGMFDTSASQQKSKRMFKGLLSNCPTTPMPLLLLLLLLLLSRFSHVRLWRPHRRQPTRLPRPWDSPGKNTGVGCHFLLQCMKVKGQSEVAQSYPTLSNPMDCSPPGSSVHGIFQARVLEWGAIAFSNPFLLKFKKKFNHLKTWFMI